MEYKPDPEFDPFAEEVRFTINIAHWSFEINGVKMTGIGTTSIDFQIKFDWIFIIDKKKIFFFHVSRDGINMSTFSLELKDSDKFEMEFHNRVEEPNPNELIENLEEEMLKVTFNSEGWRLYRPVED